MGTMPNAANPLHYRRYKGPDGENTRVTLNGRGIPAAGPGAGTGVTPPDQVDQVIMVYGGQSYGTTPPTVVFKGGGLPDGSPKHAGGIAVLGPNTGTGGIGNQVVSVTVTYKGKGYKSAPTVSFEGGLNEGDIFAEPAQAIAVLGPGGPGTVHVEVYNESDFLMLGIPATF
jgi:hypothetical protein